MSDSKLATLTDIQVTELSQGIQSIRRSRTTGQIAMKKTVLALAVSGMVAAGSVQAQETGSDQAERSGVRLPQMNIVGDTSDDVSAQPGAVSLITSEDIEQSQPRSTEDVLRRVPGIYIKGEEDSAVVTNVGVRGLPAGDYKTLVLEDGVPVQPGTFVGNSRYYNPRIQRMEGVELLKGASSLRYGPNNIGGVINYQTKTPDEGVAVTGRVGSWATYETSIEAGGRSPSDDAYFGVIATHAQSDGWMDKGWEMTDVMVKAGTEINHNQFVGVKFSYYENEANISYRGYFEDAYDAGATFNPGKDDYFLTERKSFDVNHKWNISSDMQLKTVAFWSEMNRDYWRYNVDGTTQNADGHTVWNFTDVLEGRNRDFQRIGVDSRLVVNHALFGIGNKAELGARLMQEEMLDTRPRASRDTPRDPVSLGTAQGESALRRNREDSADSLALFAQNRFDIDDRLSVTASLRLETYEQKRKNLQAATDAKDTYSNTEVLPGLGATYWLIDSAQVYGSVYQAFAPPLVGSVVGTDDKPTEAEKSLNVELGLRGGDDLFSYELTAFQMDFSNQVDPGISGIRSPNEGSALIQGVEAALGYAIGHGFRVDGNVTFIPTAEYGEDRAGEADKGNRLAYSPEWTANVALAYRTDTLQTALLLNFTDEVYGDGMNRKEIDPENHMGGLISSYYTLDLTASVDVMEDLRIFGAVKNLTDEQYIAGLRQGIYAGQERNFELGFRYEF